MPADKDKTEPHPTLNTEPMDPNDKANLLERPEDTVVRLVRIFSEHPDHPSVQQLKERLRHIATAWDIPYPDPADL